MKVIESMALAKEAQINFAKIDDQILALFQISPLKGEFQKENLATALEAVRVVNRNGFKISEEAILYGVKKSIWPGRFQIRREKPLFVLPFQCLVRPVLF